MIDKIVRFDDGAASERMMGIWSRLVGEGFLDWLNLPTGLKCVDVGCGSMQRTLLNSKTRGPQVRALARFKRPLKHCRAVKRKILKRLCARRFQPMQKTASRRADLPTQ